MQNSNTKNYLIAFIMVCSLFFLWGFAISMLDGLNRKFQVVLGISRSASAWVQVCTFGAYFIMALPAGYFMKKYGYKKGILAGLLLYGIGAILVYPALSFSENTKLAWTLFLVSLFVLACGLAMLETAANPYSTVLGSPKSADFRINLAQSFNGLGVITGPLVAGLVLFSKPNETLEEGLFSIQMPYLVVGVLVLLVFLLFTFTDLPEIQEESPNATSSVADLKKPHFRAGVLAQFFNVGAQACVWGFFINYVVETYGWQDQKASYYLSMGMVVFMLGRFISTFILKKVAANKLLGLYGLIIVILLLSLSFKLGMVSLGALILFFFFQSITFPTIFSLAIKDMGSSTKIASSYVIMGIVGGAVFPPIMGKIADNFGIGISFILPAALFACVSWYGFKGSKL